MNNSEIIKYIGDTLLDRFRKLGFIVQRYDSYTTNSIYLKLDYGVGHSIRISDHNGKKYLSYRYNIILNSKSSKDFSGKFPRFYYSEKKLDSLVNDVIQERQRLLNRYGPVSYCKFMSKRLNENENPRGFWKGCKTYKNEVDFISWENEVLNG